MTPQEIDAHLGQFENGASLIVSPESYKAFFKNQPSIGYDSSEGNPNGSCFVLPKDEMDKIIDESKGDISKIEEKLGFPKGHFDNNGFVRVDIANPQEHGVRMATGTEPGANEFWNTKADADGKLPEIAYVKDSEGNNTNIVDTGNTKPEELSKLNGQYCDEKGNYYPPNTEGYAGKTSGGLSEAVVDRVPNNSVNISYTNYSGFNRGESGTVAETPISNGYAVQGESADVPKQKEDAKPSEFTEPTGDSQNTKDARQDNDIGNSVNQPNNPQDTKALSDGQGDDIKATVNEPDNSRNAKAPSDGQENAPKDDDISKSTEPTDALQNKKSGQDNNTSSTDNRHDNPQGNDIANSVNQGADTGGGSAAAPQDNSVKNAAGIGMEM